MTPCAVSMTTILCLVRCNPIIGPVRIFITTKCLSKVLSPTSNLSVAVVNGFSNWPFANCIKKLRGSSILKELFRACCLILSNSFWLIALTFPILAFRWTTIGAVEERYQSFPGLTLLELIRSSYGALRLGSFRWRRLTYYVKKFRVCDFLSFFSSFNCKVIMNTT